MPFTVEGNRADGLRKMRKMLGLHSPDNLDIRKRGRERLGAFCLVRNLSRGPDGHCHVAFKAQGPSAEFARDAVLLRRYLRERARVGHKPSQQN